jgi:hypothetical protein
VNARRRDDGGAGGYVEIEGDHAWEVLDRALRGIGLPAATRIALDEPTNLSGKNLFHS